MGTFEEFLSNIRSGAEMVGQRTSDFVEITKIKMSIADIEKEIAAAYEGLGRLVYDANQTGEDAADMVKACIENIDELQAEADDLRERVYAAKHLRKCGACGAMNAEDAEFCNQCGAALGPVYHEADDISDSAE